MASRGCSPYLNVAPPSLRLNAGWKPALHLQLEKHQAAGRLAQRVEQW